MYAGGVILPRPHVHVNGHANESNTDETDLTIGEAHRAYHPYPAHSLPASSESQAHPHHKSQSPSTPRAHNTFQRELQRSIDHYRHNEFGHL